MDIYKIPPNKRIGVDTDRKDRFNALITSLVNNGEINHIFLIPESIYEFIIDNNFDMSGYHFFVSFTDDNVTTVIFENRLNRNVIILQSQTIREKKLFKRRCATPVITEVFPCIFANRCFSAIKTMKNCTQIEVENLNKKSLQIEGV